VLVRSITNHLYPMHSKEGTCHQAGVPESGAETDHGSPHPSLKKQVGYARLGHHPTSITLPCTYHGASAVRLVSLLTHLHSPSHTGREVGQSIHMNWILWQPKNAINLSLLSLKLDMAGCSYCCGINPSGEKREKHHQHSVLTT